MEELKNNLFYLFRTNYFNVVEGVLYHIANVYKHCYYRPGEKFIILNYKNDQNNFKLKKLPEFSLRKFAQSAICIKCRNSLNYCKMANIT